MQMKADDSCHLSIHGALDELGLSSDEFKKNFYFTSD